MEVRTGDCIDVPSPPVGGLSLRLLEHLRAEYPPIRKNKKKIKTSTAIGVLIHFGSVSSLLPIPAGLRYFLELVTYYTQKNAVHRARSEILHLWKLIIILLPIPTGLRKLPCRDCIKKKTDKRLHILIPPLFLGGNDTIINTTTTIGNVPRQSEKNCVISVAIADGLASQLRQLQLKQHTNRI
jgi:hypothetical protein